MTITSCVLLSIPNQTTKQTRFYHLLEKIDKVLFIFCFPGHVQITVVGLENENCYKLSNAHSVDYFRVVFFKNKIVNFIEFVTYDQCS